MPILSMGLMAAGLAAVVWGLPAAHRLARPWDILAALAVLGGLVSALMGTLLAVVPGFFQ